MDADIKVENCVAAAPALLDRADLPQTFEKLQEDIVKAARQGLNTVSPLPGASWRNQSLQPS